MTYYAFLGFIVFLVVWHNLSEVVRLRWRVMVRADPMPRSIAKERLIATLVFSIPTVCLVAWSVISFKMLARDGDLAFAVGAWFASVGLGGFFAVRGMYRALNAFRQLVRKARIESSCGGPRKKGAR